MSGGDACQCRLPDPCAKGYGLEAGLWAFSCGMVQGSGFFNFGHTRTHTHTQFAMHSTKRCWLSENPRQLVIRQDKQNMSDANRRLSAVQGAETRP